MPQGQRFSHFLLRSRDHQTKQWKVVLEYLRVLFRSYNIGHHRTLVGKHSWFGARLPRIENLFLTFLIDPYRICGVIFGTQPDWKPSALVFRLSQCQQPLGLKLEPGRGLFVTFCDCCAACWKKFLCECWHGNIMEISSTLGFDSTCASTASLPQLFIQLLIHLFMFSLQTEHKDGDEAPRTQSILANKLFR